ncbi:hypothetical protein ACWOGY_003529 [Vibrio vulnificus]|uniref:hypothetical protein n=1 Tax=Vibrio vulnificus TaxID=672 RepID=UPI000C9E461E|nr:hypothetical protein [Vibrio vulnificus]EIV1855006.1 hypothetical protein [Vibrio vulnificus]PNG65941.1 hypothetical protein SC81_01140 [Vibrio vulnificus]POC13779.1 hypothetical protein CRN54_00185 [Vibrio vulnificus]POC78805.1 hypothetical protein CRN61_14125 [Vibrio vulnificus]RZP59506.1 hypothetical protein D8T48_04005 [Vibrio vulnificus]
MLTQDVTKELEAVLEQLQQQGKEPSVALVKTRLKTSVPMPAIIAALKSWKSAQRVPKIEVASQTNQDAERIAQLEATVLKLAARIDALEAQLKEKNQ